MKKYKTGIVIGRFQPFHLGHKYVIEKALDLCDRLYLGIGSAQIFNAQNPYSAKKRKQFLELFLKEEGIKDRIINILTIDDFPDDDIWFQLLIKRIPNVEVIVGDNEWVNGIFERHGIPAMRIGYYKRHLLEGTKIRTLLDNKKSISQRVPSYIAKEIHKS